MRLKIKIIARLLSKGRSLLALIIAGAFCLVFAQFSAGIVSSLFTATGISLCALGFCAFVIAWKLELAERKKFRRESNAVAKELLSTLGRLGGQAQGTIGRARSDSMSTFGAATIPETRIISKPDSHYAGRQAASQQMSGNDRWKLSYLLEADPRSRIRHILFIGGSPDSISLCGNAQFLHVGYASAIGEPPFDASCCLIDLRKGHQNPWSDVVNASRTTEFLILREFLHRCKEIHIPIVVIPGSLPDHFSADLFSLADIVLDETHLSAEQAVLLASLGIRDVGVGGKL